MQRIYELHNFSIFITHNIRGEIFLTTNKYFQTSLVVILKMVGVVGVCCQFARLHDEKECSRYKFR